MNTTVTNLAASARVGATTTSAAVDLSEYLGEATFVMNSSVTEGAGMTSDVKITHCDTAAGSFTDSGIVFDQVTNVSTNGFQTKTVNIDGLKQFVKVVTTLAGTTPFVTRGVSLVAQKQYA